MKIECMIVDDEPLALRVIARHLEKIPGFHLKTTAGNAFEAMENLNRFKIDLVFLDIDMPELNGLDMIRSIQKVPKFIFVTAFREFAAEAFEVDAIDYLLKPVSFPRFLKAVNKFKSAIAENELHNQPVIQVRADRQTHNINIINILYIEGLKDYIKIYSDHSEVYITHKTMTAMEEELESHGFIRCHKSYLVSVSRVRSFTADYLVIGNKQIPIGKSYRKSVTGFLSP
jgi:two-component system, LytTR family, response regulator